jgi:hypothetical protein
MPTINAYYVIQQLQKSVITTREIFDLRLLQIIYLKNELI